MTDLLKTILWYIVIVALFIVASYSLFSGMATVQENRELSQKIHNAKVGQHVDLAGCGFLKTRGRR